MQEFEFQYYSINVRLALDKYIPASKQLNSQSQRAAHKRLEVK